jgi:elongation factor P
VPIISSNEFKNGMTIIFNGQLHTVVQFQHIKPGKGHAFVRTKLRSLKTGAIIDYNFRAKENIEQAYIEKRPLEYLYRDPERFYLMDHESYEQIPVPMKLLEGKAQFLKENTELLVSFYDSEVIDVQLPDSVVLKIVETPPGVRGDTVSGATKPAKLETGATIQVPLFVNSGESVRVDTRTGQYLERA